MTDYDAKVATGGSRAWLRVLLQIYATDQANNRVHARLAYEIDTNGSQTAFSNNTSYWSFNSSLTGSKSGSFTYNLANPYTILYDTGYQWWNCAADGTFHVTASGDISPDSPLTNASVSFDVTPVDFSRPPYAPGTPSLYRSPGSTAISITSQTIDGRGLDATDYHWRYSSDNWNWSGAQGMGTGRTATLNGALGNTYWIQTRGATSEGWSGWSDSSTAFIPNTPGYPGYVNLYRSGSSLNATTGNADERGSQVLEYQIELTTANQTAWSGWVQSGSNVWFGSLELGASYRVRARARNEMGWGPYSESGGVSIPNVPAAPASIGAVRSARNVTVTTGTADGRGAAITGYFVQYSTNGGATWSTAQAMNSQTYTYSNLAAALTYTFRTYATSEMGNGLTANSAPIFVQAGGKRRDGTSWVSTSTARRWDGAVWVDLGTARRWNGSSWVDLS